MQLQAGKTTGYPFVTVNVRSRCTRLVIAFTQIAWLAACSSSCGGGSGDATLVQAERTGHTAELAWSASADARVVGYRVYYGTAPGTYLQQRGEGVDTRGAVSFVVSNLRGGQTYYFAVTAHDGAGSESDYSSEASKTFP